jgi:hypothetical protein
MIVPQALLPCIFLLDTQSKPPYNIFGTIKGEFDGHCKKVS